MKILVMIISAVLLLVSHYGLYQLGKCDGAIETLNDLEDIQRKIERDMMRIDKEYDINEKENWN